MEISELLAQYPSAQTYFLPFEGFDHRPLITSVSNVIETRKCQFKYDSHMTNKEGFREAMIQRCQKIGSMNMTS